MSGTAQKRTVMLLALAFGLLGLGTMLFGAHSPAALTGLVTDNTSAQIDRAAALQELQALQADTQPAPETTPNETIPETPPETPPPAPTPPAPSFSTEAAAPRLVDPAVERALFENGTADVLIILKEGASSPFDTAASQEDVLAQRKASVAATRAAFAAEMGFGTATTVFAVTREYDTLNAIGATINSVGLDILRTRQSIEQIVLDRTLTVDLTASVPLIDADDVWNLTVNGSNLTGKGQVICIIDTGIDINHTAFTNKVLPGQDYVNEDNSPQDDSGHGTHVSGIAAGNSSPVLGVAKDAKILPAKVCDSGGSCADTDILAGIDFCNNNSATYNISAISGSLGDNSQYNSTTCPTSYDAIFATSNSLGIIPVFASGNNAFTSGINHPACSPNAISVGSTTKADAMSSFTNRGGDRLDVLAPGSSIVSALVTGGTISLSGTSMATPHVSGAIAIIQQNQRALNRAIMNITDMRTLLQQTGVNVTSWQRVDVYNAIAKLNQNYTINITDSSVANGTTRGARVRFSNFTDLSRFVDCGTVRPNFVGIDSNVCPQYNKTAHITFANITGIGARPLRNGAPCPPSVCQNFTFGNGTVDFDVTEFSNYSSFNLTNLTGCANVNVSSVLTQNISSTGNCINITGNNVILFCNGFTVAFDTAGGGLDNGIRVNQRRNITVDSCIIRDTNAAGAGAVGIVVNGTNNSVFINNFIQVNGTTNNNGFILDLFADNVTIANNTVNSRGTLGFDFPIQVRNDISNFTIANNTLVTVGLGSGEWGIDASGGLRDIAIVNNTIIALSDSGSNFGIRVNGVPFNLRINDNNISVNGSGSYAFTSTISTTNSSFSNNVLGTTTGWINTPAFVFINITNTTFRMPNGSITIPGTVQLNESTDMLISKLNITFNNAYLNSSNLSALNTTAIIALNAIGFNDPKPQFRFGETGAFTDCTPTVNPFCTELGFSGGVFTFNVSHFTGYISAEGGSVNLTGCATINASSVLTQNIASNDTCVIVNASNIVFSCAGRTILFGANGSGAVEELGILVVNQTNVTIADCVIATNRNSSSTLDAGVGFRAANYSTILNTTFLGNSTFAVTMYMASHNDTVTNSTVLGGGIDAGGSGPNGEENITNNALNGSVTLASGRHNVVAYNVMNSTIGVQSGDAFILYNNVTFRGTAAARGIDTDPAGPFVITGNRFEIHTNATGATGLHLASSTGNFSNNTFLVNGTGGVALLVEASAAGIFFGNNFTAVGNGSIAIRFDFSIINNSRFNNTILSASTFIEMDPSGGTAKTGVANFTNTTFFMPNGSVTFPGTVQANGSQNVTQARLNITFNSVFLNSSNLSFLNQTAVVTLTGIMFNDPKPQVAFVDGGAFSDCTSTANPFCTELSYANGVFRFNTSHFTSFDSAESTITNCTLGPVLVNSSIALAQDLTGNGTCLIANTDNIAIDCAGFAINFDRGGGFSPTFGIGAQQKTNITITGCTIRSVNASGQNGYAINFSNVTQSVITNSTLIANGSNSIGVFIGLSSVGVNVTNNTIGASPIAFVVDVSIANSSFINVRNSILIANSSTGPAEGIQATSNAQFIAVSNNSIRVLQTSGSQATGFVINGGNATFAGNTLIVNLSDTSDATGVNFGGGADFMVENNTIILAINTTDTINTKRAFQLSSLSNAVVRNNTIILLGSANYFMGMLLSILSNVTIANTNITSLATTNTSLIVIDGTFGTTVLTLTNTTLSSLNDPWIQQSGTILTTSNFTNTTFIAANGAVQFPGTFQINNTNNVSAQRLNITSNLAFLNSTNLTFLNQTAVIALKGIASVSPKAQVAFVDGGAFSDCTSAANPFCTELGYAGGVFTFNTSHFTSYQTAEGAAANITSCPVTINVSTTLTQNLNLVNGSVCVTFGNDSIVLDCAGFSLNNSNTSATAYGINATDRNNITVRNCLVENFSENILWTNVNNSFLLNTTARNSSSFSNIKLTNILNSLIANTTGQVENRVSIDIAGDNINITLIGVNATSVTTDALEFNGNNSLILNSVGSSVSANGMAITGSAVTARNILGISNNSAALQIGVTGMALINSTGRGFQNAGIRIITSDNSVFVNNTGLSGLSEGFLIFSLSSNVTLLNNTGISNGSSAGISLVVSNANVTGNTGIGSTGISFPLTSTNSFIIGNNGTGLGGISIGGGGGSANNTLLHNIGTSNSSGAGMVVGGNDQTVINNTGTSITGFGFQFVSGTGNDTLINNTGRSVNGSGIRIQFFKGSTFLNNTAASDIGVALDFAVQSSNNTFANTTLYTNTTWIRTDSTSIENNLTNTLFQDQTGSIRVFGIANIPGSANVSIARLNTSANRAYLNSSNLTFFNTTAVITLTGITSVDPKPQVDFADSGSFVDCTPTANPFCTELGYAGGVFTFNTSHFTSYQSAESAGSVSSCPVIVNTTSTLTQNLQYTGTGSCITINNSNIVLGCSGFSINGSNGAGYGINATRVQNITIRDCFIENFSEDVRLDQTNLSLVTNVTARNASAVGISLLTSNNNTVGNVTIRVGAATGFASSLSDNNTLLNANVTSNGSLAVAFTGNRSTANNVTAAGLTAGIQFSSTFGGEFGNLIINSQGTGNPGISIATTKSMVVNSVGIGGQNRGISLPNINNVTLINVTGISSTSSGIVFENSNNNTLINSTARTGTSGLGAFYFVTDSNNSLLIGNTFAGDTGDGIGFGTGGGGFNRFFNNTIYANSTWIDSDSLSGNNNFTNTTFVTPNGSINLVRNFTMPTSAAITIGKLNVTSNRAFLNSTNLSFLNMTAVITLNGISSVDPKPQVDFADSGSFADCTATADPFCTEISYTGGVFTFNASHFTSYQSAETATNIIGGPATINTSTNLTQNITSNSTGIIFGNDSIVLDCQGNSILYDADGSSNSYGVLATGRFNVTVRNCIIIDINSSGAFGFGIFFNVTNSSLALNNTIKTNGTSENTGVYLLQNASRNRIVNNTIITQGSGGANYGIYALANSAFNNITSNTVRTNGSNGNYGIHIRNSSGDTLIANNSIRTQGDAETNVGVNVLNSSRMNITANSVVTNGTFTNFGIVLQFNISASVIANNIVSTNGNDTSNFGIYLVQDVGENNITGNTITTNGTSLSIGIEIDRNATRNLVQGNTVATQGSGSQNHAIRVVDSSFTNVTGNTITTGSSGASTNQGIRAIHAEGTSITQNTVTVSGTGSSAGITIFGNVTSGLIFNNSVTTGHGVFDEGIDILLNTSGVRVIGNTVVTNGTRGSNGITLENDVSGNIVANNTITSAGNATSFGIWLQQNASNNTLLNNTIITGGSFNNHGIGIETGSNGNIITNTNITTVANASYGVNINQSNGTVFTNTRLASAEWLLTGPDTSNTFTNTTFQMPNGTITITGAATASGLQNVSKAKLNITNNRAFLNASNLSFLNQTGVVVLNGLTLVNPNVQVDFADSGVFTDCTSTANPFCTKLGYAGGVLTFNTSHFTAYASLESSTFNVTLAKSDSPDPVNASGFLNYTITVNVSLGNASNITLTDRYPNEVIFQSSQPTALAGTNDTFVIGNLTQGQVFLVNVSVLVLNVTNGTVINNTANISFQNQTGSLFALNVTENTTVVNVTVAPTPTPQGNSGGSGGGGGFSVKRNETAAAATTPAPSACVESWACEQWGPCQDGSESRICIDLAQCGTALLKPDTERSCVVIPLREQPIPVEPEQPAPVQVSAPVPVVVQEKSKSWTLAGILPVAIDVLLILFALIAMTHMLRYRSDQPSGHWLAAVDIIGGITLIALVAHYVISKVFLPVEYITFVVLLLFVAVLRLAERGRESGAPRMPKIPALPDAPPEIELEEEPAPKKTAVKPLPAHRHAGPKKPLFSFFQPKPKVEDDMKDVFDSLDRISTLLERNKVTIRAPKKKGRVRKK